jgi:hypothetical protein
MGIKIKPFYDINPVPIYRTLDEEGVLGVANDNKTIRLSKDLTNPAQMQEVIDHEMVHIDQFDFDSKDTGNFAYDNENMYFSPKNTAKTIITKRSPATDGNPALAQEVEADNKKIQQKIKKKYNAR